MLRREKDKLAFSGFAPAADRERLLKVAGLYHLDEATLLGVLLDAKARLQGENVMESIHNKGREALRVLHARKDKREGDGST